MRLLVALVVVLLFARACSNDDEDTSAAAGATQTSLPDRDRPGDHQDSSAPLDLAVAGFGGEAALMDTTSYELDAFLAQFR